MITEAEKAERDRVAKEWLTPRWRKVSAHEADSCHAAGFKIRKRHHDQMWCRISKSDLWDVMERG